MKTILFTLLWVIAAITLNAQNYIGQHKLTIKKKMREEYKDFIFSKEVTSKSHHFIKFEEINGDKTFICVLDNEGYCKYSMLMCDYAFLKSTIDSLNNNYESLGNLKWVDHTSGKNDYIINLKKEEWYFTLITKRKNTK